MPGLLPGVARDRTTNAATGARFVSAAEPVSGDGADTGNMPSAQITLSSWWKTNDLDDPAANYCHLSGQVIAEGVG